jgi:hypothetical protein
MRFPKPRAKLDDLAVQLDRLGVPVQFCQHFSHPKCCLWILRPLLARAVVVGQSQFKLFFGSVDVAQFIPILGQAGMQTISCFM